MSVPFYRGKEREDFEGHEGEEEGEEGRVIKIRIGIGIGIGRGRSFAGRNLSETRTWQSTM